MTHELSEATIFRELPRSVFRRCMILEYLEHAVANTRLSKKDIKKVSMDHNLSEFMNS